MKATITFRLFIEKNNTSGDGIKAIEVEQMSTFRLTSSVIALETYGHS